MVDTLSKEKRSWLMSRIRSTGSRIEKIMETQLQQAGIKFEKHPKNVFGKPDFVIRDPKVAIFCDSEFWHSHKSRKEELERMPTFWKNKIKANEKRDKKVNRLLKKEGWIVLRFWGSEIKKNTEKCVENIVKSMGKSKIKL